MFDEIDEAILSLLKENSKYTNKELGEKIHMTGQAVGVRISKLIEHGVIKRFTIDTNENTNNCVFVKVFFEDQQQDNILFLIKNTNEITEAYLIEAEACYLLKVSNYNSEFLDNFLKKISSYTNYQLSLVGDRIK